MFKNNKQTYEKEYHKFRLFRPENSEGLMCTFPFMWDFLPSQYEAISQLNIIN